MRVFLLFVLYFILVAGVCEITPNSEPIAESDLFGVYKANFKSGLTDQIEILPSGKYIRTYRDFDSNLYIDTNYYTIDFLNEKKIQVWITFPKFKKRFEVDSTKADPNLYYYSGERAIIDSTANHTRLRVWKFTRGNHIVIYLGDQYRQAWLKYSLK